MIFFFFFSFTSSKREGISFPADGALEGSKRKAKQRVSPGSKKSRKELEKRQNKQVLADSHALWVPTGRLVKARPDNDRGK